MPQRSLILTGAPATGKTTLYREMLGHNFEASPPHMTREKREDETEGIDAIFIPRPDFQKNLSKGLYFEKTEDDALYSANNEYYGCPENWINEIVEEERRLAVIPTSLFAATCLAKRLALSSKERPLDWVHLYVSQEERIRRIRQRGNVSEAEIAARMKRGDTHNLPAEEFATVLNTDGMSAREVLHVILQITNRR